MGRRGGSRYEKMVPSSGDRSWAGDGVCVRRERTEPFEPRSHSEGEEAAGNRRGYGATLRHDRRQRPAGRLGGGDGAPARQGPRGGCRLYPGDRTSAYPDAAVRPGRYCDLLAQHDYRPREGGDVREPHGALSIVIAAPASVDIKDAK